MDIILPIMIVAMLIGTNNHRMNAGLWMIMSAVILLVVGHFMIKH